jgi:hypothetical protein
VVVVAMVVKIAAAAAVSSSNLCKAAKATDHPTHRLMGRSADLGAPRSAQQRTQQQQQQTVAMQMQCAMCHLVSRIQ